MMASASSAVHRSVVHLVPQLRLGAGRYVVDTAVEQARQGLQVSAAIGRDAQSEWRSDPGLIAELRSAGIPVHITGDLFHRSVGGLLEASRDLHSVLSADQLGGVGHAHTAMAAAVARWAGFETVVATCHGWNLERDPAYDLQDALAFRLVDGLTSPSAHWVRVLEDALDVHGADVIPVGLDLRRYPAPVTAGRGQGPQRIVCVAELSRRKGVSDLVEAMPAVWRQCPGVELHLMGDGDGRAALQEQARRLDPDGRRIVFHGFVPGPFARLGEFDLFCLPSHSDNFPVALMEAMLARRPVVATEVGGIPELVRGAGCGRVVPPRDPDAIASAVLDLFALPAPAREALGVRGEVFIRERCSIDVTVAQLRTLYTSSRGRSRRDSAQDPTRCA
jgi:glycosyltransferase involved in cell wall biosynthesis